LNVYYKMKNNANVFSKIVSVLSPFCCLFGFLFLLF